MNIATLDIFVDVMRKRSLSAVARARDLTPSSISRAVSALEAELGTRLFQRNTRRVVPTEAAILLLARVEHHLEGLRLAHESIAESSDKLRGVVRVTASVSFGVCCISPLLSDFTRLHPDLRLELWLTDTMVDLLAERYDVAIRHGTLPDSGLVAQILRRTRYYVCASPSYLRRMGRPQEPSELFAHHCLVFPLPGFATTWKFRNAKKQVEEVEVSGEIMANSGLVLRKCALDGAGLVLLSDWLIGDDLKSGQLIDVFPLHDVSPTNFQTSISAVYPSRKHVPKKVKALIEFLKQRL